MGWRGKHNRDEDERRESSTAFWHNAIICAAMTLVAIAMMLSSDRP